MKGSRMALAAFLVLGAAETSFTQQNPARLPFSDGERLTYKVKWSFIRLGTVSITQRRVALTDVYEVRMDVTSAAGLPFINVNFANVALLRPSVSSMRSVRVFSGEDPTAVSATDFDHATGLLIQADSGRGTLLKGDTTVWNGPLYDALSLFMATRERSAESRREVLPTLVGSRIEETELHFTGEREEVEVAALNDARRCVRVEGVARWEGESFAGMTGEFRGWVTDDPEALPLRAELKIFLGSIVLELEDLKRNGLLLDSLVQKAVTE